jgi:hypothetical protein
LYEKIEPECLLESVTFCSLRVIVSIYIFLWLDASYGYPGADGVWYVSRQRGHTRASTKAFIAFLHRVEHGDMVLACTMMFCIIDRILYPKVSPQ